MDISDNGKNHPTPPSKQTKPSPELFASKLRDHEHERRPNRFRVFLVLLLLFAVPLAFFTWWFWPSPPPPEGIIVAFDAVGVAGTEVSVVARVEANGQNEPEQSLRGWPVVFARDPLVPNVSAKEWSVSTQLSAAGAASVKHLPQPAPAVQPYVVVYCPKVKTVRAEDRAHIFTWPAQSNVILVDVEVTLTKADAKAWQRANIRDLKRDREAAEALATIARRKEHQIVYLACRSKRPRAYRKVRMWINHTPADRGQRFPIGPVLGRADYQKDIDDISAIRQRAKQLKKLFRGRFITISSDPKTAAALQMDGLQSVLVHKTAVAQKGIIKLADWLRLTEKLP